MSEYYSVKWIDGKVNMIDQRLLPHEVKYDDYCTYEEVAEAINVMVIRGAPAIGAAAGYGMVLAVNSIENEFRIYSDNILVDVVSDNKAVVYVPEDKIARIIGKQGSNIDEIEKRLGIGIDIKEIETQKDSKEKQELDFETKMGKKAILFYLGMDMQDRDIDVYVEDDYLLTAKTGKTGNIKIKKNNKIGKIILNAVNSGEKVKLLG